MKAKRKKKSALSKIGSSVLTAEQWKALGYSKTPEGHLLRSGRNNKKKWYQL